MARSILNSQGPLHQGQHVYEASFLSSSSLLALELIAWISIYRQLPPRHWDSLLETGPRQHGMATRWVSMWEAASGKELEFGGVGVELVQLCQLPASRPK